MMFYVTQLMYALTQITLKVISVLIFLSHVAKPSITVICLSPTFLKIQGRIPKKILEFLFSKM